MNTTGKPTPEDHENDTVDSTTDEAIEDAEVVGEEGSETAIEGDDAGSGDAPSEEEAPTDEAPSEDAEAADSPEDTDASVDESVEAADDAVTTADDVPPAETETDMSGTQSQDTMSQASSIPPAPAPVAPPPAKSGPGFMPLVLGGIVAGLIGYVLAYATEFRLMPNLFGRADPAAEVAAVRDDLSAQAERLAAVEGSASAAGEAASAAAEQAGAADQAAAAAATAAADAADAAAAAASQASTVGDGLAALEVQVSELTPVEGDLPPAVVDALRSAALDQVEALGERVGTVEGTVGTVEESVGALTEQIEALGGIQAGATSEQMSAYEEQLAVLQAELDAQRESIAAAQAEAEAMTAAAAVQQKAVLAEAALSRVKAAVDGGGAFDGPLSELSASTEVAIPEILMGIAGTGIRSLPQLQDSFPVAARAGLDAAVAELAGTGTAMDRVGNFLRNQTGARSLSEREGDDPDAILSRAQARLSEGDVAAALAEIATLNEAGQAAMADWVSEASARVAAQSAVDDLSTALAAE